MQSGIWPQEWSETEIAYFAGLFDGEGCIGIYKHPRSGFSYKLTLSNTDPRPLIRAHQIFGGHLRKSTRAGQGTHQRDIWRWEPDGRRSSRFLMAIYPHLIIKKEQASIFLRIIESVKTGGRRRSPEHVAAVVAAAADLRRLKREEV